MKVLVVDDEAFTVDMLRTFLQINGYETIGSFNGESGLMVAQAERPDIMILDLMLPDIEGFEVCRRLRSTRDIAGMPVIVLSARVEASSRDRAFEAGVDAYLTKPVQFPLLLSEIERLTEAGTERALPPTAVSPVSPAQTAPVVTTPPSTVPAPPVPTSATPTPAPTVAAPLIRWWQRRRRGRPS
jgi:two-component system OmpR family response regulator